MKKLIIYYVSNSDTVVLVYDDYFTFGYQPSVYYNFYRITRYFVQNNYCSQAKFKNFTDFFFCSAQLNTDLEWDVVHQIYAFCLTRQAWRVE